MKYIVQNYTGDKLVDAPSVISDERTALQHAILVYGKCEIGERIWVIRESTGLPLAYAEYHDEYKKWLRKYGLEIDSDSVAEINRIYLLLREEQ